MWVRLTATEFHPIKKETEEISVTSHRGCVDPKKILEKRKDKNCTDNCIPIILSSLFDMSTFKECSDYDSHFCALEDLIGYVYERAAQCTNPGVEKYLKATLHIYDGISYANYLNAVDFLTTGNDDERSQTLLYLNWLFSSPYVNDREEVLVYGAADLVAWIGGGIGLFGGYSIYDLLSQMIDLVFSLITRFSNTNI